jgi:hypothetical protein
MMGEPITHTNSLRARRPASHSPAQPEYVVYSFSKQDGQRGGDKWLAMGISNDIDQARAKARALFQSARYSRIEVRKKYISEKTGAVVDVPLEIFGQAPDLAMRNIKIFLGLAFGCATAAIILSLMIQN